MSQPEREKTSINIKPDLWKKVKIEAIQDGIDVSVFHEQALEFWVRHRKEFQKK